MGYVQEGRGVAGKYSDRQMISKAFISKNRVLILAVAFSLGLHLFWISSIKIIMKSGYNGPVKFSKVSFLGPVYTTGGVELKARPKETSFLEKRYRVRIAGMPESEAVFESRRVGAPEFYDRTPSADPVDDKMISIIGEVLEESKSEPGP